MTHPIHPMFADIDPPICYWALGQAMDVALRQGYQRGYERGYEQASIEIHAQQARPARILRTREVVITGFDREAWEKFKAALIEHSQTKAGVLVDIVKAQQTFCTFVDSLLESPPALDAVDPSVISEKK
jgi:hypothetical protein